MSVSLLQNLRLHAFRCFASLDWSIPARGALILGDNAQGKTSLLEALCFALRLDSPRAPRAETLVRHGSQRFGILLATHRETRRVVWEGGRADLRLDNSPCASPAEYLAGAPSAVWFGNGDIAVIRGNAEERRRRLDFLGPQWHPGYRGELARYRHALRSRNALLKQRRADAAALRSFTQTTAEYGERVVAMRRRLLDLLLPHLHAAHRRIAGREEPIGLIYRPSTERPLEEAMLASLDEDRRLGFTRYGPHRDDFALLIHGVSAAEFGSEGQQRTLALALQLAHASLLQEETGMPPVLFIDDIFGELDPSRRRAFLAALPSESAAFITTTRDDWNAPKASPEALFDRFLLAEGRISPAP